MHEHCCSPRTLLEIERGPVYTGLIELRQAPLLTSLPNFHAVPVRIGAGRHHFRGGSETMMLQRPIRRGKYLEDREMIRVQVDADGSGTIDFDEFVKKRNISNGV